MKFQRMDRSRLLPKIGFWHEAPGGGPALREGPYVRSGAFLNTERFGLLSIEWRRS